MNLLAKKREVCYYSLSVSHGGKTEKFFAILSLW